MFPSSGYGQNSKYFDADLLLDGSYQITSVTLHSSSEDETNPEDVKILRAGLLLVPSLSNPGYYEPLDTRDGYLNGDNPTQSINSVVVLARKQYMDKDFILGMRREREVSSVNKIVPVYLRCTIFSNRVYYNNMDSVSITDEQWDCCQRIKLVPPGTSIYDASGDDLRALLYKRKEVYVNPSDL